MHIPWNLSITCQLAPPMADLERADPWPGSKEAGSENRNQIKPPE